MSTITATLPLTAPDRSSPVNAPAAVTGDNEEATLVSRAQRGDVAAFEQLYRLTAPRVYTLCLRMVGDSQRARELSHDAFVRAWESLGSYRGQAGFASWLHRLTVNTVLQDARSSRRRDARVRLESDSEVTADAAVNEVDTVARIELDEALLRLTVDARRVVVLHDIEGYRHDEIAAMLGVAPGTVRARLHHARRQLKEWLTR